MKISLKGGNILQVVERRIGNKEIGRSKDRFFFPKNIGEIVYVYFMPHVIPNAFKHITLFFLFG